MKHLFIKLFLMFFLVNVFSTEDFILVEGGHFTMGNGHENVGEKHEVLIDSFYISKYESTFQEWESFYNEKEEPFPWNRSSFIELSTQYDLESMTPVLPMFNVSWLEAILFCNWKSREEGFEEVYIISNFEVLWDQSKNGYRLPTEAEWEFAARGGNKSNGYLYSGGNDYSNVGWYKDNSNFMIHPVGLKNSNELGIFDMSGNIAEWCWDFYDYIYYSNSPYENPTGPSIGNPRPDLESLSPMGVRIHTSRGSSYRGTDKRDVYSRSYAKENDHNLIGVRLVRSYFSEEK